MVENKEMKSFYTKMNRIRAELLSLDWKDDKFLTLGGMKGYNYLSIDKMKRNLAPVLQAQGMDLGIEYCELTQLSDPDATNQHWTVKLKASLIDIDTGFERVYTAYGESSDHGDKGVNKAQTAAMKQFLSNTFMLIDGIDPDAENSERGGSYVPKTPLETVEAKSKVLSNAVKPKAAEKPAPKVKISPKEKAPVEDTPQEKAPVEDTPKEETVENAPEAPVTAIEPETPKEDLPPMPIECCDLAEPVPEAMPDAVVPIVAESVKELKVSVPQRNAIANIIAMRTKMALEGQISVMEYNTMSAEYADIKDNVTGSAFINKYKVVGRSV